MIDAISITHFFPIHNCTQLLSCHYCQPDKELITLRVFVLTLIHFNSVQISLYGSLET